MDLLASLGLDGALPEQSTRISSHPGIAAALECGEDVRLGFNRCLRCGVALEASSDAVKCRGCKRVGYCSSACRKEDSTPSPEDEETGCCGHSPVVCSLLSLCDDDEDAEEHVMAAADASSGEDDGKGSKGKRKVKKKDEGEVSQKAEAARYRVRTELESYPATLFNVLSEGPGWYAESLTRRLRLNQDVRSPPAKKRRRDKRDRSSLSPKQEEDASRDGAGSDVRALVLHVVGASADSELWGWDGKSTDLGSKGGGGDDGDANETVLGAYAEASTNLTSFLKNLLEVQDVSVRCIFVGPDCPKNSPCKVEVPVPDSKWSKLAIETHRCHYGSPEQPYLPAPDAIVFFNPGFSCTDYDWRPALDAACAYRHADAAPGGPIPFLVTTNTEMEGYADVKFLLEGGYVDPKSLPGDLLEAVDCHANDDGDCDEDEAKFFFGENPYAGLRVRQSGTMGNDLYVKSRWILGGLLSQTTKRSGLTTGGSSSAKRKAGKKSLEDGGDSGDEETRRKRKRIEGGGKSSGGKKNSKRKNPALI